LSVHYSTPLDLKLAPNPALSTVTVSIEGVGAGGGTLLVFDGVGRLVLRQVIAENQQTAVFQVMVLNLHLVCTGSIYELKLAW
jgi:hypothetical protein